MVQRRGAGGAPNRRANRTLTCGLPVRGRVAGGP